MIELFMQCCERFLAADAGLCGELQAHGFELIDGGWHFTLPQLHGFLCTQCRDTGAPAYTSFRQQLFDSPVNTRLAGRGGMIVIADNCGKVDLSTYRLQPRGVTGA